MKTEVKIDKGVPMPVFGRWGRNCWTEALLKMEIGDSFEFPNKYRSSVQQWAWRYEAKITTRKVSETHLRVWLRAKPAKPIKDSK